MPQFSEDLWKGVEHLTNKLKGNPNVISVGILLDADEDTLTVTVLDPDQTASVPQVIDVEGQIFKVEIRKGAPIVEHLGDLRRDPPFEAEFSGPANLGGDQIRTERIPTGYGTLSFTASQVDYEVSGRSRYRCNVSRAIVSNNHVIAASDQGRLGDRLFTTFDSQFGALACFIPLRDPSVHVDLALGQLRSGAETTFGQIRQFGALNQPRRPSMGEGIRKYGARTGPTFGTVTGIEHINVGDRTFNFVFRTSRGFGCRGDSGSAVLGDDMALLGLYSWGERLDCSQNPHGHFWPFVNPGFPFADNGFKLRFSFDSVKV